MTIYLGVGTGVIIAVAQLHGMVVTTAITHGVEADLRDILTSSVGAEILTATLGPG